jgi:hypothetical protein
MNPEIRLNVVWTEGKAVFFSSKRSECVKVARNLSTLAEVRSLLK